MSGRPRTGQRQRRPASPGAAQGPAARSVEDQGGPAARRRRLARRWGVPLAAAAVMGGLFAIYTAASHSGSKSSAFPYQVGSPGPGQAAPAFALAASTGTPVSLSQYRGKTVLLFFQEGLTCQPCWTQIADMERHAAQLRAAGVSQVIS